MDSTVTKVAGSDYGCAMSSDAVLSIVMLAAIALVIGAFVLWRRGGRRMQVALMLLLAAVMVVNVTIWVVPDDHAASLGAH
jgi:hypothetical protein